MPTISRFYGIVVFMNYADHEPPHFHVRYQDQEVIIEIESDWSAGRCHDERCEWFLIGRRNITMN